MTKMPFLETEDHLSAGQAAFRLGVSRHLVLSLTAGGTLHALRMGGRLFYATKDVDALGERLVRKAPTPPRAAKQSLRRRS
jgi:hypothetical protein